MKLLKKIILAAVFVLTPLHSAMATNVAVIYQEAAVAKSKVGVYVNTQLDTISKSINTEFEPFLTPLNTQAQQLNAEYSALSPDVARTRNDLARRDQDLRRKYTELAGWKQRQMAATEKQALTPVLKAYGAALKAVITEKKIDVVFLYGQNVVFLNDSTDITDEVIAKMDVALTTTPVTRVRVPRVAPTRPAQQAVATPKK